MKRVVLFKSASEEYEQAFAAQQLAPLFVEPLQFEAVNGARLAAQLARRDLAGLLLSSPRAVDAVARCWEPARFALWSARKVYAVGDATARKIKLELGLDALGATAGNAHNLAKIILKENEPDSTFLFPCGNLASETLPGQLQAGGMAVETVTVYETKENENLRNSLMELNNADMFPCCMVFFSPSGCEYIHRQLQTFANNLYHLPHFAIGNSTAHKIENLGIEIAGVASQPKAESVLESVQNYFISHQTGS